MLETANINQEARAKIERLCQQVDELASALRAVQDSRASAV